MYERDIRDSRDRIFDSCFLYWGRDKLEDVDDFEIRNHMYKCRQGITSDIPKDGHYAMPEEMFGTILPARYSREINSKFRNVQYVEHDGYIYWIYAFSSLNLYKFRFIGDNVSDEMLRALMQSSGFILGFKHRKEMASMLYSDRWIEIWFHPEKLHVAVFEISTDPTDNIILHEKVVLCKKFEGYGIEDIHNTSIIFKRKEQFITVPFIKVRYPNDEPLYWTKYIKPTNGWFDNDSERELTESDLARDSEYYMQTDYEDMLKIIFNKES